MTLTSHTDFAAFLEAVQQCRGEVLFCTREGDKLNLKSTLSKYLFAALAGNEELLRKGKIVCLIFIGAIVNRLFQLPQVSLQRQRTQ